MPCIDGCWLAARKLVNQTALLTTLHQKYFFASNVVIKEALNPNFLNLTIYREKILPLDTFWSHFLTFFC